MSRVGIGYDRNVTTFSPDGRLFQVEYAARAVDNAGIVVGIKCKDGVVMGAQKCVELMMITANSGQTIHSVHGHAGAIAGLAADGRQIAARARAEAINYRRLNGEPISVKELADRVASFVHLSTLYWSSRPYGCGIILDGYDSDGRHLYMIEPSGVSYSYFGVALGKKKEAAKTIYGVDEKELESEMSWVCDESKRQHHKIPDVLLREAKADAQGVTEMAWSSCGCNY